MYVLRYFESGQSDRDDQAYVAVYNRYYPRLAKTVQRLREDDAVRDPDRLFQRFLFESDGVPIGCGCVYLPDWINSNSKIFFDAVIAPEYVGSEAESVLFEKLMATASGSGVTSLATYVYESQSERLALLEQHGFGCEMRFEKSELDVRAFEKARFEAIAKRVRDSGIAILTGTQLRVRDADYVRKLWDLAWMIELDLPGTDPPRKMPLEVFETWLNARWQLPDGILVAVDGERYVGLSNLKPQGLGNAYLEVGITGVLREYRRRGIATAIKLETIAFAKRYGAVSIETTNEESNPMFLLNQTLGFASVPAWLAYAKTLAL